MNPFFNQNGGPQASGPFSNMQNLIQQFRLFKDGYRGNPQQEVQDLLNSGRMSQQQFNQLAQLAQQFQSFFKR